MHKSKLFFLSTTRQFNGTIGYSKSKTVRIELDGEKLNERYEGIQVNYWGSDYRMWEFEDRLCSTKPTIEEANKYIKKIYVLLKDGHPQRYEYEKLCVHHMLLCASQYGIEVAVFDNEKDFNNPRSTNTINNKIKNELSLYSQNPYDFRHKGKNGLTSVLGQVLDFCRLLEGVQYDDIPKYVSGILKKYRLEQHTNQVIKYVLSKAYAYRLDLPNIDLYFVKGTNDSVVVHEIMADILSKYGLRNTREANIFWNKQKRTSTNIEDYDTQKTIKVLCFKQGFNKIAITDPNNTPFWSIFNKSDVQTYKNNMIDRLTNHDEYYGIRSHKSKDNESFNKYIKHLTLSPKITVSQMLDILSKIDYSGDIMEDIFWGQFIEQEISYWDTWKVAMDDESEDKIKELFRK